MRQSWQCCFLQEVATMTHQHRVNMGQLSRVGAHRGITEGICRDLRHLAIGIPDSSANREHVTRNLQAVFIDQDTFTFENPHLNRRQIWESEENELQFCLESS